MKLNMACIRRSFGLVGAGLATVLMLSPFGCAAHAIIQTEQEVLLDVSNKIDGQPVAGADVQLAPLPVPANGGTPREYLDRVARGRFNQGITNERGEVSIIVNTTIYKGLFDFRKSLGERVLGRRYLFGIRHDTVRGEIDLGGEICGEVFCVRVKSVGQPRWQERSEETDGQPTINLAAAKVQVLANAKRELLKRESWGDSARLEAWRRPNESGWWVTARRGDRDEDDPKVDAIMQFDEMGELQEYRH